MVTGAGSGLGRALSVRFAEEGCVVIGLVRSENHLDLGVPAGRFEPLLVDVSVPEQVSRGFAQIENRVGAVDFLINNAAVYPKQNFLDETPADWEKAIAININGVA